MEGQSIGWDGSGNYNRVHNFSADASAGIKILASRMDAEINDMASAFTRVWTRDGQNTPTTDLPMGGRKFVNVGAPTSVGNFMRSREFIENVPIFMQDAETSADRVSVSSQYFTSVSANQAPVDGTKIMVRVGSHKSSAVLYLDGHSANIEYQDGNRIAGALVSGGIYEFTYSSVDTAWKLPKPDDGRTDAERNAGVTPVNFQIPQITVEGVLRYKANVTPGTTDMQPAFADANNVGYAGFTDGTNSPFKATTGIYGIGDTVDIDYGVSLSGDGMRSTRLVALSDFTTLSTVGMVRIGNGAQVSGGSRLTDMIIDCSSFASSRGVMSSDIQHGGAERVTVNNFRGVGFNMDANGTAFGSINGYLLQQCEAFKANVGGTGGTAYYLRDGTFFPLLQLCQSYGNPSNPLATGFDINNTPVVMLSSNVDGAATIGIDFNTSSQGAVIGFTANGATTAVNIDTALDVFIASLYMPSGTSSVVDAGAGGGKAKTLTQASVPLYWRGGNYAHGDFLKIWGTEEVIDLYVNGTIRYGQSATTPDIADGGTVSTSGVSVSRYTPAASRTGLILAAGSQSGQMVTVINNSAANTMTFAAAGTSNVADGTGMVIAALKAAQFIWDSSAARWFHCA